MGPKKNIFLRVHRTLLFAAESQTLTQLNSECFTFHLFLPYCGWQWCIQLNCNSRVLTSYDNVSYLKNTTRAYATHINNNWQYSNKKKTLTKCKMQKFYKATHPQHEAISSAMSDVVMGDQGLSSDCLQCSLAVNFQPWWHHTTSSLHTNVSHTFVQLDCL